MNTTQVTGECPTCETEFAGTDVGVHTCPDCGARVEWEHDAEMDGERAVDWSGWRVVAGLGAKP
jgi:endogenous inhibitor of DNA gyrase (YacG/DUF329 family)